MRPHFCLCIIAFLLFSCGTQKTSQQQKRFTPGNIAGVVSFLYDTLLVDRDTLIDHDITFFPGAFVETTQGASVVFKERVQVIGESQVFSNDVNIVFEKFSIGTLNPCWFGARGNDVIDDSGAFVKTLQIAEGLYNSINIYIPTGEYLISQPLIVESTTTTQKSINLIGEAMSASGVHGASLHWVGTPGETMLTLRQNIFCRMENLDLSADSDHPVRYNLELKPVLYQLSTTNCSFAGAAGPGSANVNINSGNNIQVSEITFENCAFRGKTALDGERLTDAAVVGGLANTKNFYFSHCSFGGYGKAAINIEVSDIIRVDNCTFSNDDVDIICLLCNLVATSNYSELSGAFFRATVSSNISYATLIGNYFEGNKDDDYVIRDGAGSLVLINNNFGSYGGPDTVNLVKWDTSEVSHIYSYGNFFKNANNHTYPFVNRANNESHPKVTTEGDKVGINGPSSKEVKQ